MEGIREIYWSNTKVSGTKKVILFVEDDKDHSDAILISFRQFKDTYETIIVSTIEDALISIKERVPDLIIADWLLSNSKGTDILFTDDNLHHLPFVLMTSYGNEEVAVESMKLGIIDYIVKSPSTFADMPHIVERSLRQWEHVTERRKSEEALRTSEERFRQIARTATDTIWCIDENYILTYISPSDEKMRGFKAEDLIGKPIFEIIDASFVKAVEKVVQKRAEDEKLGIKTNTISIEAKLVNKDGSSIWTEGYVTPTRDKQGEISGYVGITRDISKRKKEEEEREKIISDLQNALSKVKTLSGMLPICASCKKIRNDKGYWQQVEVYMEEHSEAEFSHGICPDCAEKFEKSLEINEGE